MTARLRWALTTAFGLGLSSIAVAQVSPAEAPAPEPLIASDSRAVPTTTVPEPIPAIVPDVRDPLAPLDAPQVEPSDDRQPAVDPEASLAEKVAQLRSSDAGSRERECLAGAIYFESKSEPLAGQLAVGQVIANRAKSGRFAKSYCGVVFQRGQFHFVRRGAMPPIPRSSLQWKTAVAIARIVDDELHRGGMSNALFFHAKRVSPGWRLTRLGTVGNHVFYR